MLSLSNWFDSAPDKVIACSPDASYNKADLTARVNAWQDCLPLEPGQRWVVYHSDTFEFIAILFALWQSKCVACLPSDICTDTINRLTSNCAGFIGELPDLEQAYSCAVNGLPSHPLLPLNREQMAIEVYTSGSTGTPKPILKTIAMIEDEIASIDQLWAIPEHATLISTVPHQHLFGLTFRLFWPLLTGRVFQTKACTFTEDIFRQAQRLSGYVLISTPSHLKRLNDQLDWNLVVGRCHQVISSAAPLARQDSHFAAHLLGTPIHEIYGSSETGALAWRSQANNNEHWQLLPQLTMQLNPDHVEISGPYIEPKYARLSDRIEVSASGAFRLLGRQDRIHKVEGKRLSLTKMEHEIEQTEWVDTAKVLVFSRKRDEVVVVAELSEAGKRIRAHESQKTLVQHLKNVLRSSFEAVLLPRRWRFLSSLPYNSQGKLSMERLHSLFDNQEVKWPVELSQNTLDEQVQLTFYIPKELIYFEGHFDKHPILPGITQTHWAQHFGRKHLAIEGRFTRLEVVKFQHVILPDTEVTLSLSYNSASQKLTFQYLSDKGVHSSGRICFA